MELTRSKISGTENGRTLLYCDKPTWNTWIIQSENICYNYFFHILVGKSSHMFENVFNIHVLYWNHTSALNFNFHDDFSVTLFLFLYLFTPNNVQISRENCLLFTNLFLSWVSEMKIKCCWLCKILIDSNYICEIGEAVLVHKFGKLIHSWSISVNIFIVFNLADF